VTKNSGFAIRFSSPSRIQAAIDVEDDSGDVPCRGAGEERDGRRYILRFAVATQRDQGSLELSGVTIGGIHVGVGRTRLDQVDSDVSRSEFASKASCEGCMVALSSVASEGHSQLGELVRSARAETLNRLQTRLSQAVADGEIPASVDVHALARFLQTVQNGMSIQARDGASRAELESVAHVTMLGWDALTSCA
jgi:hypothetical protein